MSHGRQQKHSLLPFLWQISKRFLSLQTKTQEHWGALDGCWWSYPSSLWSRPSRSQGLCVSRYTLLTFSFNYRFGILYCHFSPAFCSLLLICVCDFQIVKEYERAVIFRLGRIPDRKPKGPGLWFEKFYVNNKNPTIINFFCCLGLFFVLPCTDNFVKVDLRTVSFDIPPQEVSFLFTFPPFHLCIWENLSIF